MTNDELLLREVKARENAHAKVRDVTPAEKSRIACSRAEEWLELMGEIKRRGLQRIKAS